MIKILICGGFMCSENNNIIIERYKDVVYLCYKRYFCANKEFEQDLIQEGFLAILKLVNNPRFCDDITRSLVYNRVYVSMRNFLKREKTYNSHIKPLKIIQDFEK